MYNKQFVQDYRSITVIDDLIMELSLIKSGIMPSVEKLEKGIELIEYLIERLENPRKLESIKQLGSSPKQPNPYSYSDSGEINAKKEELEEVIQFIKKSIESIEFIQKDTIESFQDQLLRLSLPIWKKQVTAITQSHFTQIEL